MRNRHGVVPVLAFAAILSACTNSAPSVVEVTVTTTAEPTTGLGEDTRHVDLQPLIDAAVAQHGGSAGIAIAEGDSAVTAGDVSAHPSWSTIKVPIAIAAMRADPMWASIVSSAIQESDNGAAEQLWAALGEPGQAAASTSAVLAETGVHLEVNQKHTRAGYSSFGQTPWSVSEQALFAAQLPCVASAEPIVADMARVTEEQRFGLGRLNGARVKGGWGPGPDGAYTVRQFGIITGPAGEVAVAIWVKPQMGTFAEAKAMADTLGAGLESRLSTLPTSTCR